MNLEETSYQAPNRFIKAKVLSECLGFGMMDAILMLLIV